MTDIAEAAPSAIAAHQHPALPTSTVNIEEPRRPAPTVNTGDGACAWALLDRALAASPAVAAALDSGGSLIIIEAPGWDWVKPVRETLCSHLNPPEEMNEEFFNQMMDALAGDDDTEATPPPELAEPSRPEWVWFCPSEERGKSWSAANIEAINTTLGRGNGVIIVTARADWLSLPIRAAADHHLVLPPLDGAALTLAVRVLTGYHPATMVDDSHCAHLTPDALRLSRRQGEGGERWMERLHSLTSQASQTARYTGPLLADIHGMDEAREWGLNLQKDMTEYLAGRLPWQNVDRGCLLVGPPGTGKTRFAQILAGSIGLPLITGSHSSWQSAGHLGQMLAAMRSTFLQARQQAPSILFIDEIDSFPDRQSLRHNFRDYGIQVVNALLEMTDGTLSREGVVLIAAANSTGVDPALIRPGRLDRVIRVWMPDDKALAQILRQHLGDDHLPGLDLFPLLTGLTASGADCELWARSAKRMARHAGRPMIIEDLLVQLPLREEIAPKLHLRIATHEAGHAVAAALEIPGAVQFVKVDGERAGVKFELSDFANREDVLRHIRILLAGRVAEELRLGSIGFGAGGPSHSDLAVATCLATAMSASHGLGSRLLWLGDVNPDTVHSFLATHHDLAGQVDRLLTEEYQKVVELLRPHLPVIERIAAILIEHGVLTGAEVEELVAPTTIDQG